MNISKCCSTSAGGFLAASVICVMLIPLAHAGGPLVQNDRFTNIGSIANTRHNMTQSTAGPVADAMDRYRNNYAEVCVYCHTPHSANQTVAAPLWNRTIKATNYQTYDELGTTSLTQAVTDNPGPASLTCLSCHDGQTAVDSIINMPGSGMGMLGQATVQSTTFLNTWTNPNGGTEATHHMGLNSTNGTLGDGTGSDAIGCLTCHADTGFLGGPPGAGLVDFRMFNIGTDLRNDHPVGITFPIDSVDFNQPSGAKGNSNFFDINSNGKMEKDEIRTYEGKVECASCHDPHGVPSSGPNSIFNKTFLRVQNTDGSAVCLTCHNK